MEPSATRLRDSSLLLPPLQAPGDCSGRVTACKSLITQRVSLLTLPSAIPMHANTLPLFQEAAGARSGHTDLRLIAEQQRQAGRQIAHGECN